MEQRLNILSGEMIGVIVLLALLIAASVALAIIFFKRKKGIDLQEIQKENDRLARDMSTQIKVENSMLAGAINTLNNNINALSEKTDRLREEIGNRISDMNVFTAKSVGDMKSAVTTGLALVKEDNAKQLEKMRMTVDEKLSNTLEERFNRSFKIVNDRLEEINRTFGELQNLQTGVNDLNKIFKNVKTRGTWGEVSLDSLLGQILAPEQYSKQVQLTRGSQDAVDFAIRMPGRGDGEVLLPIDAKFPSEDYVRLVEASERGDAAAIDVAAKSLSARIRQEAMSIRDKYIKPPKTTDFAIMYLPTEGLYAEAIRRDGVIEEIQNKYRVIICGPTTIAALLNSLQMGFKSLAIEKRSTEIGKLLTTFLSDFDKFSDLLRKTGDKLGKVQDTIADAEKRTEIIRKRLGKVGGQLGDGSSSDDVAMLEAAADDGDDYES